MIPDQVLLLSNYLTTADIKLKTDDGLKKSVSKNRNLFMSGQIGSEKRIPSSSFSNLLVLNPLFSRSGIGCEILRFYSNLPISLSHFYGTVPTMAMFIVCNIQNSVSLGIRDKGSPINVEVFDSSQKKTYPPYWARSNTNSDFPEIYWLVI